MRISGNITLDPGQITDTEVSSATRLAATKMQHVYRAATSFGFVIGGTPTTREEIVFVAREAGAVLGFGALLNVDGSSTAISFDLKKNGTTMLSGTVDLTDTTGDRVAVDGTLASSALVAGDVLSIAMTVTSSTGAQGPHAWAIIREDQVS